MENRGDLSRSLLFDCQALTEVWTAGSNPRVNDRLRLTGLLGGIRWWSEAVVRGFGVRACDPVSTPCSIDTVPGRCAICALFGNAQLGLAAKFAIRAWRERGRVNPFTGPILRNSHFFLEFYFYRQAEVYELYLLIKTLNVISAMGSIGGKTTLKPTRPTPTGYPLDAWRARHADYGIMSIRGVESAATNLWKPRKSDFAAAMQSLARKDPLTTGELPCLTNFWFAGGATLFVHPSTVGGDDTINNLLGLADSSRPSNSLLLKPRDDKFDRLREHLRGLPESTDDPRSKRVFSFGSMGTQNIARTWLYVLDSRLAPDVPRLLQQAGVRAPTSGSTVLHSDLT